MFELVPRPLDGVPSENEDPVDDEEEPGIDGDDITALLEEYVDSVEEDIELPDEVDPLTVVSLNPNGDPLVI